MDNLTTDPKELAVYKTPKQKGAELAKKQREALKKLRDGETEAQIERHLVRLMRLNGRPCLKLETESGSGWPDRMLILKGRTVFVELKRKNGVLSEMQKKQIKHLGNLGHTVWILRSKADVHQMLHVLGLKTFANEL